ncbi:Uncharacterized protein D0Z07_5623 [Hyphodiscus hymeniophilus]|uniref:Thioredoxin-like protein n=1 Tax=Hyphodiscus hymeniophilus TaxID=353542 RepID=A0A9P7AW89_9HELO|nr:Uncharacterized protein D0Z07_5623 [Hyphodiscus hymeniophilus]
MAESTVKSYSTDPALYLYTSLTSGSSHVVTATSRLETILKANRIPFKALDIATDEKARMLWGRRSGKDETGRVRKIPGLVQMGLVVGDLVEIEEWNEYGELKEHVTIYHEGGTPAKTVPNLLNKSTPSKAAPVLQENKETAAESSNAAEISQPPAGAQPTAFTLAMRQAGLEAAQKAKDTKKKATETFTGVGEAEPEKNNVETDKSAAPSPISTVQPLSDRANIVAPTVLQSPTSSTWQIVSEATPTTADRTDEMPKYQKGSLQSPTSTSWQPTDLNAPISMHRGSSISLASKEAIQQIEEECAIPEEDEGNDESEEAIED